MAKITKMVANRRGVTHTVVSSASVNKVELGARLERIIFKDQVPDPLTMADVVVALTGVLQEDYETMEAFDREVASEVSQDGVLRDRRDAQIEEVRQHILAFRSAVDADYGTRAVSHLGLDGDTAYNADGLITQGRNVLRQLEGGLSDFEPRFAALGRPDYQQRAAGLSASLAKLEETSGALVKETRETQDAQTMRNKAEEVWAAHYAPVAAILENLYRLAEMPAHADRVRPTSRRRAGLPEDEDVVDDGEVIGGDEVVEGDEVVVEE